MKKTVIILMVIAILSKVLGFFRDIALSYFYGASNISDAYLIAITIPTTIFAIIGVGIAKSYIPVYSNIIKYENRGYAEKFTNNVVNFSLLLSTLVVVLVLLFTAPFVKLFASGFDGRTLDLAVSFTRISVFTIYFSIVTSIFTGYLQSKDSFIIPALIGIPANLCLIISIALSTDELIILPIGILLSIASYLVVVLPFAYKAGFRYRLVLDFDNQYLKRLVRLAIPVIIGSSINEINMLVDRTLASQIENGGISALVYASNLNLVIQGVFVASLVNANYPSLSNMAAANDTLRYKASLSKLLSVINILLIPATVGIMIFSEPIVDLLYGRGAFNAQAITLTSKALFFYSIGIIGFGYREVLTRAFYAIQDTKTPLLNAGLAVVLNIFLNIVLSQYMGLSGLALATSISAIVCSILLFFSLKKKVGKFDVKIIWISFSKVLISSIVMALFSRLVYSVLILKINLSISLIVSILIGIIVYLLMARILRLREVNEVLDMLKRKVK